MKKNILLLIVVLLSVSISAQEVIATQGASYSNTNNSIDFTIGEVVIATLTNTNNVLTQGFHQTNLTVLAVDDFDINYQARVFPNPAEDFLQLDIQNFEGLNYKIYTLLGKELAYAKINKKNTDVNLGNYAKGLYFLAILNENNQKLKTYRILKK